jgi:hypothetical protein
VRCVWRREVEWGSHVPRRAITKRKFSLPSWWFGLAPGKPPSFWVKVERTRIEAGVSRSDEGGITYIIHLLASRSHK